MLKRTRKESEVQNMMEFYGLCGIIFQLRLLFTSPLTNTLGFMSVQTMLLIGCLQSDIPGTLGSQVDLFGCNDSVSTLWVLTNIATSGQSNPFEVCCYIIKSLVFQSIGPPSLKISKSRYFVKLLIYTA